MKSNILLRVQCSNFKRNKNLAANAKSAKPTVELRLEITLSDAAALKATLGISWLP